MASLLPSFFGSRKTNAFDPFSLDIRDPFEDLFSSTPVNVPASSRETSAFVIARIDWKETPEAHVFRADLPGLGKAEVRVEVEEGRILQISGERSKEDEGKNDKWHRIERSSGKFLRRFRLPSVGKFRLSHARTGVVLILAHRRLKHTDTIFNVVRQNRLHPRERVIVLEIEKELQ